MRSTRTIPLLVAVAAFVFVFTAGPVSAATKAPVKLGQKVNVKGTKDVSSKSSAKLAMELDDKYFAPTFIKAKAGEKITLEMENEGNLPHTFTSDGLAVDQQVDPGKSAKLTFTVPSDGQVFQFHCTFHETAGMVGGKPARASARLKAGPTTAAASGVPAPVANTRSYGP